MINPINFDFCNKLNRRCNQRSIQMRSNHMRHLSPQPEIRHGIQYIARDKQPSMFEILTWKENKNALDNKDWLTNLKNNNKQDRFTEPRVYEKVSPHLQNKGEQNITSPNKNQLPGHHITHQLYYYGKDQQNKQKKNNKGEAKVQKTKNSPTKVKLKEIKRLNKFNDEEKRQIQIRKQNIKSFDAFTRDLPNSAFTTYFGKPAFQNYGYNALTKQISNHKTHSVMPHAGKNIPQNIQSYQGALNKANVINLQSHVPRKPIQKQSVQDCQIKVKEFHQIQIVKPDLINQVRFANDDHNPIYKSKTPRHNELNHLPKRQYPPTPQIYQKPSPKKAKRMKTEEKDDGLAFMNHREKFMKVMDQKKKIQNRLAYKPTECYPLDWDFQTEANSTGRQQKWKQIRPAGISSARSADAKQYIYR